MTVWAGYIREDFSFTNFAPGSRVLDVGCGEGAQLAALREAGCRAMGVEPDPTLVEQLQTAGFSVRNGVAEQLPVEDAGFDGLVCKVVVPYTDERQAVAEWARVLRPGARVLAGYHGAGYYLRHLLEGPGVLLRAYALRALVNTWWYRLTGRRLPGFIGDTLYQSPARLDRYYDEVGFSLEFEALSPRYKGHVVFIYHELMKAR